MARQRRSLQCKRWTEYAVCTWSKILLWEEPCGMCLWLWLWPSTDMIRSFSRCDSSCVSSIKPFSLHRLLKTRIYLGVMRLLPGIRDSALSSLCRGTRQRHEQLVHKRTCRTTLFVINMINSVMPETLHSDDENLFCDSLDLNVRM